MNKLSLSACESAAQAAAILHSDQPLTMNGRVPANWMLPIGKNATRWLCFSIFAAQLSSAVLADSLWKDDARPLVGDKRALAVGDILTILVQESTTTAKDNSTKTAKQTGLAGDFSALLGPAAAGGAVFAKNGEMKINMKSDFAGGGTINNTEKIVARVAVRVIDVLPNRNLVIEGSRETSFSGEKQTAVVRGTVRSEDINGNNTVFSYNIADATIRFVGKGTITDTQRKGWLMRIWDKVSPL